MKNIFIVVISFLMLSCSQCMNNTNGAETKSSITENQSEEVESKYNEEKLEVKSESDSVIDYSNLTEAQWKKRLTTEEFHILREKGTERAFTGTLLSNKSEGIYVCKGCGTDLFNSSTKFKSGTGWPSFYDEIDNNVEEKKDNSYGMERVELVCITCKGHLGHVFTDGPNPTGLRYCINSLSLSFKEKKN